MGRLNVLKCRAAFFAMLIFLSACGGGSGGSSGGGYSAAAIPNEPPVFAIPSQKSFLEGAPGLTLVAIDANDDNIVFALDSLVSNT